MGEAYSVTNSARWLPIAGRRSCPGSAARRGGRADLRGRRGRGRSHPDPRRQPERCAGRRRSRRQATCCGPDRPAGSTSPAATERASRSAPIPRSTSARWSASRAPNGSIGMSLHRGIARFLAPVRTWGTFNVFGPVAVASVRSTEWIMETPKHGTNVFVLDGVVDGAEQARRQCAPAADLRRRRGRGRHHGGAQEVGRQARRRRAGRGSACNSEVALAYDPWQAALVLGLPVPDRRDRHRLVASRRAQCVDRRAGRPPARSAPRRARTDQGARRVRDRRDRRQDVRPAAAFPGAARRHRRQRSTG